MTFTSIVLYAKWLGWCVSWQLFTTLARQRTPLRAVYACCHAPACAGKECLASHHKQSLWEFLLLSSHPEEETLWGCLLMDLHTITVKLYCIYVCVLCPSTLPLYHHGESWALVGYECTVCVCTGGHGVTLQRVHSVEVFLLTYV